MSINFFFQAEDGIRVYKVTGVQTCALPIFHSGLATHLPVPPQTERAWDGRHVLYVLEPSDTAFTVDLDFSSVGLRSEERRVGKERRRKKKPHHDKSSGPE